MSWQKPILQSAFKLGLGEATARLASFAVLAYISRRYGMEVFGAVALAQTVWLYAMQGTDMGFRLIGARTVARNPGISPALVSTLLRKRSVTGGLAIAAASAYAAWGPMGEYARLCVAGFAIGLVPYLFSLDWLAWGLDRIGSLSAWKGGVALAFAAVSFLGFGLRADPRISVVIGNFTSLLLGSVVLWFVWRHRWRPEYAGASSAAEEVTSVEELGWKVVLRLGTTVILTQAFHNADTLLLAGMAPLSEVGRYNSAYKILLLVCGGYYLITQSLYPQLSRARGDGSHRRRVWLGLGVLAVAGAAISVGLSVFAQPILTMIYGYDLGAVTLMRTLSIAVPLDFIATTFGMSFVSRGYDKFTLLSLSAAAASNIIINLILIPRMGAEGAALATLGSYVVLNIISLIGFLILPVFSESVKAD